MSYTDNIKPIALEHKWFFSIFKEMIFRAHSSCKQEKIVIVLEIYDLISKNLEIVSQYTTVSRMVTIKYEEFLLDAPELSRYWQDMEYLRGEGRKQGEGREQGGGNVVKTPNHRYNLRKRKLDD